MIMAAKKAKILGSNVIKFEMAGPGQMPAIPHPIPKRADPTTSLESIWFAVVKLN